MEDPRIKKLDGDAPLAHTEPFDFINPGSNWAAQHKLLELATLPRSAAFDIIYDNICQWAEKEQQQPIDPDSHLDTVEKRSHYYEVVSKKALESCMKYMDQLSQTSSSTGDRSVEEGKIVI